MWISGGEEEDWWRRTVGRLLRGRERRDLPNDIKLILFSFQNTSQPTNLHFFFGDTRKNRRQEKEKNRKR